MRISKEVTIGDKKITIYELTVKDIKKLWQDLLGLSPESGENPLLSNQKLMHDHWNKCVHGLKLEETDDMAPSELKLLYDAFSEVNAIFFDLALKLEGENPFLKGLREVIVSDLTLRFAALSAEVMQTSGNTDTPSS